MKKVIIILLIIAASLIWAERRPIKDYFLNAKKPAIPRAVTIKEIDRTATTTNALQPNEKVSPDAQKPASAVPKSLPTEINLAVPFQSQAPFGDWAEPYKEACEEASLIMVDYFLRGASLSAQQMKEAIDAQVAWEGKQWAGNPDLSINSLRELADVFYDYQTESVLDLTIEKIKDQLRRGHPVIVPAAGRQLGNPYFRQPGPYYHMLVIKGYTKDGWFITNDPGTRRGADYLYKMDILMAAIHDWGGDSPDGGKTGMLMY